MATGDAGELVTYARTELLTRVRCAVQRIWLASPFLSKPVADEIAIAAEESSATERRLLTALVASSVQTRALDPSALETLLDAGFEICSVTNLYAKASLIDTTWGLVGSGNLTNSGLGSEERANVELGVILDAGQIATAAELFTRWWDRANPVGANVLAEYAALPRLKKSFGQPFAYGGPVAVALPQSFEDILAEDEVAALGRGYWSSPTISATTIPPGGSAVGSATGAKRRMRSATSSFSTSARKMKARRSARRWSG
jgi:phosphatidylserine/phosphatidylglycerophosphate/cardiolipin synthase-like enzyme